MPGPVRNLSVTHRSDLSRYHYQIDWDRPEYTAGTRIDRYEITIGGCESPRNHVTTKTVDGRGLKFSTLFTGSTNGRETFGVRAINRHGEGPCVSS